LAAVATSEETPLSVHDLRQPLTAILSAATALRADPSLDDETRDDLLRVVAENAARLGRMLDAADSSDTIRPSTP
jgi:K+-sensing histidine kinase KdpD